MRSEINKFLESNASVYLAYAICALAWGTGWFAVRLSVGEGGYPVFVGAALRYTIAAVVIGVLIGMCPQAMQGLDRKRAGWLLITGLLNATAVALLYWGEKTISGGLASVLSATSPIMALLLAVVTRTERIAGNTLLGFCVALAGVTMIFGERLSVSPSHLMAMMAVLGSAFVIAMVNVIMKAKATKVNPLQSSLLFFVSMSAAFWLSSPCEGASIPWPLPAGPTGAIVFLAIGSSGLALPAFFFLLRRSSLMFASSLSFVHPIIALLTDSMFERSFNLSLHAYLGMSIVLAGLLLCVLKGSHVPLRKKPDSEAFAS